MTDPPETAELLAFVRIVDAGSLSAASRELGQPRATIGRRLARLEDRLGVRLLRRTTRRLAPTDAGDTLYRHARPIVDALEAAEDAVRRTDSEPRGLLRVSVPQAGGKVFSDLFVGFLRACPRVQLQILATNTAVDLMAGTVDVAVRAGLQLHPGLIARLLSTTPLLVVGSPAYLAAAGTPLVPDDLADHTCISGFQGEHPLTHWPLMGGGTVRISARMSSNEMNLTIDAARADLGLILVPRARIAAELSSGTLVPVLEGIVGTVSTVAVVYPEREYLPPAVRAFVDHAVSWARTSPYLDPERFEAG